jgi:hypothetical protein
MTGQSHHCSCHWQKQVDGKTGPCSEQLACLIYLLFVTVFGKLTSGSEAADRLQLPVRILENDLASQLQNVRLR